MKLFKNNQKPRRPVPLDKDSQKVVSYYTASRKQLNAFDRNIELSNKVKIKRHFLKVRRSWLILFVLLTLLTLAIYSSILSSSGHIIIKGPVYRSAKEYQAIADPLIRGNILNRIKFFFNEKDLQYKLGQMIPESQSVNVSSSILSRHPTITLYTSEPMAIFQQSDQNSLIMSTRGKLIIYTDQTKLPTSGLAIINNNTGVIGVESQQFISPEEAQAISRLLNQFAAEKSPIILELTNTPHELVVKEAGRGYKVRFLMNDDIVLQFGAMRATQNQLLKNHQNPSEYLDVRLVEKVYYK
jgi:hypothetical protein